MTLAQRIAPASCPVLIMGPTGVGKDVLAEDIHRHSRRAANPFVAVNCAAISTSLFESELFGHQRGAYTSATSNKLGLVELAAGGTLFLDEIGELPLDAQAKLLRFLSRGRFWPVGATAERSADVRIIAATNRDIPSMLDGRFREDLYYRLSVVTIRIPPLESVDARAIARKLASEIAAREPPGAGAAEIEELAELCAATPWRGGARELRSVVERYFLLCDPDLGVAENFRAVARPQALATAPVAAPGDCESLLDRLGDVVFLALARDARDVRDLATRLNLSQQAIYHRLQRLGVKPRELGGGDAVEQAFASARGAIHPFAGWLQTILRA